MKSTPLFPRLLCVLAVAVIAIPSVNAADVLVLKSGERREGEIVGVQGRNVLLRIGPAQSTLPLADVVSAEIDPPTAFATASERLQGGNPAGALVEIRPLVQRFGGLPTEWVKQAFAMQGDALVQLKQLDEAERHFEAFKAAYPDASNVASVASARLDIARGNFDAAREKLTPVVAGAAGVILPEPAVSANLGRAFLLMGQVHEAGGDLSAALHDYLRTVTIFYADANAVAEAQERAQNLEKKNVIVP